MGLTPCRAPQVLRRRVGRHSQPVNPHPMRRREKAPCLSSNRSTMESMIDSGKIYLVDTAVESQPGRATNNTGSRSRPKRALSCPFLPMAKRVPVMRNRRGMLCSPDTGPGKRVLGRVGCMLKSSSTAVTVIGCATLLRLPTGRFQPGGGSGRKGRRPVDRWLPGADRGSQPPLGLLPNPEDGAVSKPRRIEVDPVSWTESRPS